MIISKVIRQHGFTIEQVAQKLGLQRGSLANMIGGNPTVETLQKIADAIGASRSEFFRDEINPGDLPPRAEPLMQQTIEHGGKQLRITIDEVE